MEQFVKIVNSWKLVAIFAKHSMLEDIWQGPEHAAELFYNHLRVTTAYWLETQAFANKLPAAIWKNPYSLCTQNITKPDEILGVSHFSEKLFSPEYSGSKYETKKLDVQNKKNKDGKTHQQKQPTETSSGTVLTQHKRNIIELTLPLFLEKTFPVLSNQYWLRSWYNRREDLLNLTLVTALLSCAVFVEEPLWNLLVWKPPHVKVGFINWRWSLNRIFNGIPCNYHTACRLHFSTSGS